MSQKMRSLVSLLALVVAGGGLGLYAFYGVHQKQEAEQQARESAAKLFDFDHEQVRRITVTAKGQRTVLVAEAPGHWRLVSPVAAAADRMTVEALLSRMLQLRSKAVVEEKSADLARFGLATPAIRIALELADGTGLTLRSGEENSFDSSVYVAVGDSTDVHQTDGNFKWALEKDAFDLRDKRLLPFDDPEVAALEIRADNHRYTLRRKDGKWTLRNGRTADPSTVNRILATLRNLRAVRFDTETLGPADAARYGLEYPRGEATVSLDDNTKLRVQLGLSELDGVHRAWARSVDATFVAEVNEASFNELKVTDFELMDKTVLPFDEAEVRGLKVGRDAGESYTLERTLTPDGGPGDDWRFTAPSPAPASRWRISRLVSGLLAMKASNFPEAGALPPGSHGLDQPLVTVTLLGEGGTELDTLLVGQESDGRILVKTSGANRLFEVEKDQLPEWPARAELEEPPAPDTAAE